MATFFLFTWLKTQAGENLFKYPTRINCNTIRSQFQTNPSGSETPIFNDKQFKEFAEYDKEPTLAKIGAGYYQCWCQFHSGPKTFLNDKDICYTYQYDKYQGLALSNVVTVLVSVVNIVIGMLVQYLVDNTGYDTDSERLSVIMMTSFVSAFINTAIITLLTNADLSYIELFWVIPLRAQYSDLNRDWYLQLGPMMVKTMAIQSIMPIA